MLLRTCPAALLGRAGVSCSRKARWQMGVQQRQKLGALQLGCRRAAWALRLAATPICTAARDASGSANGASTSAANDSNAGLVQLAICVPECSLQLGEHLRVVGACPELGSWDPSSAPQLEWQEGDSWRGQLRLAPGSHEFKLVVFREDRCSAQWEEGANRTLAVPQLVGVAAMTGPPLSATCSWGEPSCTILAADEEQLQAAAAAADARVSVLHQQKQDMLARLAELTKELEQSEAALSSKRQEVAELLAAEQERRSAVTEVASSASLLPSAAADIVAAVASASALDASESTDSDAAGAGDVAVAVAEPAAALTREAELAAAAVGGGSGRGGHGKASHLVTSSVFDDDMINETAERELRHMAAAKAAQQEQQEEGDAAHLAQAAAGLAPEHRASQAISEHAAADAQGAAAVAAAAAGSEDVSEQAEEEQPSEVQGSTAAQPQVAASAEARSKEATAEEALQDQPQEEASEAQEQEEAGIAPAAAAITESAPQHDALPAAQPEAEPVSQIEAVAAVRPEAGTEPPASELTTAAEAGQLAEPAGAAALAAAGPATEHSPAAEGQSLFMLDGAGALVHASADGTLSFTFATPAEAAASSSGDEELPAARAPAHEPSAAELAKQHLVGLLPAQVAEGLQKRLDRMTRAAADEHTSCSLQVPLPVPPATQAAHLSPSKRAASAVGGPTQPAAASSGGDLDSEQQEGSKQQKQLRAGGVSLPTPGAPRMADEPPTPPARAASASEESPLPARGAKGVPGWWQEDKVLRLFDTPEPGDTLEVLRGPAGAGDVFMQPSTPMLAAWLVLAAICGAGNAVWTVGRSTLPPAARRPADLAFWLLYGSVISYPFWKQ